MTSHASKKEVQATVPSQQLTTTSLVLFNLNICKSKPQTVKKQRNLFPKPSKTQPLQKTPPTLRLHHRSFLINLLINYLMQPWTFFPRFVVLHHTLQAVTEVIVGSFKIFLGQPLSSIVLQELGGVSPTLCAPSACAHSGGNGGAKKQELKPKAFRWQNIPLSATTGPNFQVW